MTEKCITLFLEEVILAEDTTSAEDRMRIIAGRLKSYLQLSLFYSKTRVEREFCWAKIAVGGGETCFFTGLPDRIPAKIKNN